MSDKERIVCDMLRELAPERDWLYLGEVEHARIGEMVDAVTNDLKAENAKLREHVEQCTECAKGLGAYADSLCDPLKAENAKLRELVEVLINCGRKYHTMSGSCPMFDADAADDDFCGAVEVARKLGIEVE